MSASAAARIAARLDRVPSSRTVWSMVVLISPVGFDGWRWVVLLGSVGAAAVSLRSGIPESPRWLAAQGRLEEAERIC